MVPPTADPAFAWDGARYRNLATGRYVPAADVRAATDAAFGASEARARALTEQLRAGTLSLDDWHAAMRREVKRSNLYGAAAADGGWAHMTPSAYGRVGQRVRAEYAYLARLAAGLADGSIPLDGHAVARAGQYGLSGRATYWAADMAAHAARGEECRNVTTAGESCAGCLAEAARGYVDPRTMSAPGSRQCRRRCRCYLVWRRAGSGA